MCEDCDYEWEYSGAMFYATCPRCRSNVKIGDRSD